LEQEETLAAQLIAQNAVEKQLTTAHQEIGRTEAKKKRKTPMTTSHHVVSATKKRKVCHHIHGAHFFIKVCRSLPFRDDATHIHIHPQQNDQ